MLAAGHKLGRRAMSGRMMPHPRARPCVTRNNTDDDACHTFCALSLQITARAIQQGQRGLSHLPRRPARSSSIGNRQQARQLDQHRLLGVEWGHQAHFSGAIQPALKYTGLPHLVSACLHLIRLAGRETEFSVRTPGCAGLADVRHTATPLTRSCLPPSALQA